MKEKQQKYSQFVISIMSKDRVGIVADVTRIVSALGGNLADLTQTVLCGYFTMLLIADFSDEVDAGRLKRELGALGTTGDGAIEVTVKMAAGHLVSEEKSRRRQSDHVYVLTAAGKDRIGLVAKVSGFLARNGINILDLATTVADNRYTMIFLVDIAAEERLSPIREGLSALGEAEGLGITLQHNDIFMATNEI